MRPKTCSAGAIAYKVMGPPPVQAKYVPPKQPMLVLVENYRNQAASVLDAQRLSYYVTDDLRKGGPYGNVLGTRG